MQIQFIDSDGQACVCQVHGALVVYKSGYLLDKLQVNTTDINADGN